MRVLITYPIGLLLKAYMQCAMLLVKIKAMRSGHKPTPIKPAMSKKARLVKEPEYQTA